jgi:hypothetical protein
VVNRLNVDPSLATLHWVEFRGLTLETVQLPKDDEHIVVKDFSILLDKMIGILGQEGDATAKRLIAIFQIARKWAPQKGRGVLNKRDLAEAGPDAVERVLGLLSRFSVKIN